MTVINPPGFLQNVGATHTAEQTRNWVNGWASGAASSTSLVPRGGVNPALGNELLVTQTGSPSMAVIVKSGSAMVSGTLGSKQGMYSVMNDADVTLAISAAHATLNRIDSVVFKIEDQVYSGSNNTSSLVVVTGTPAGSPSPPTLPDNCIELARVSVVALDTSITNGEITDTRRYVSAVGGVILTKSTDRPAASTVPEGQLIYEADTDKLYITTDGGTTWTQVYPHTGVVKIAENLLVGTAASIVFSSIPATYRGLMLQVVLRGDTAATSTEALMRFNGDTGANYDYQRLNAGITTVNASEALNSTSIGIGDMAASTATAGAPGISTVMIPFYAGTTFWKMSTSHDGVSTGTATGSLQVKPWAGRWRNTAAINSITILPAAGNWIAGSSAVLYGLP
jgi:hypothetical protein